MNNRGQSLVTFVLLIPILSLILYMVYEIGRMTVLKNELNSINNIAMDYALDNMESDTLEEDTEALIRKNKSDIDVVLVSLDGDKVYIVLSDKYDSNISLFKKSDMLRVRSSYVGYMDNDRRVIKRVKTDRGEDNE